MTKRAPHPQGGSQHLDLDCDCGASVDEQQAYELIQGRPYPADPKPQDRAIAHACLNEYKRQERQWKADERRAKAWVNKIAGPFLPGDKAPPVPLESDEQKAAAEWLDALGLCWIHVPNEGKRSKRYGASLKSQGLKPGFPDILIFTPPPNHPDVRFVAIELKRQKGGRVSDNQRQWLRELRECGGLSQVCNGADAMIWYLEGLGYGARP